MLISERSVIYTYNKDVDKKCPKCNRFMEKLGVNTNSIIKWKCPGCGHDESIKASLVMK